MTSISSITLDVADTTAAEKFYADAFGLGPVLRVQQGSAPSGGFRGYTLSLVVAQPSTVSSYFSSAVAAGATVLKAEDKSMWGYGGLIQAPDGAIWNIATSSKKGVGAPERDPGKLVMLIGAEDVGASKKFYVGKGLKVGKSFGSYAEFELPEGSIGLGLYKRKALAKSAGVSDEGSGSHRITIGGDAGVFVDPDGFAWS